MAIRIREDHRRVRHLVPHSLNHVQNPLHRSLRRSRLQAFHDLLMTAFLSLGSPRQLPHGSQRQQPRHKDDTNDQHDSLKTARQREQSLRTCNAQESTTSVFTGEETGVMKAVEAASATIIAKG